MQFEAAIDVLVRELRRRQLKSTTISAYRDCLGAFAKRMAEQGVTDLRQVGRQQVEEHQGYLLAQNLRPRTVAVHIQALRRLFELLTDTGQLLCDPTESVVALKWTRRLPRRRITELEMQKLLAAPDGTTKLGVRDRALIEVLYSTALRARELLSIEMTDVERELGVIHIREGKGCVDRVVPVGKAAQHWLKEYIEQVRPYWLRAQKTTDRLWLTHTGRPLNLNTLHALLRNHAKEAAIAPIYPHAVRHAAATHLLSAGADLRMVQKLLGHRCLSSTVIYTRVAVKELLATHAKTHPLEAES